MSDTQLDSANQVLNAFMHRKKTHDNTIALNAQKLVNLFRQLSVLRSDFVSEYNQMLLESPDEVRMMMKDIVGGPTVRQYLDYLQQKSGQSSEENGNETENTTVNINSGYLPNPDDDMPFVFGQSTPDTTVSHGLDKGYIDALAQTLSAFQENNRQQMDILTQALKEMKNQIQNDGKNKSKSDKNTVSVQDLAQIQSAQQTAFEQMLRSQNEALSLLTEKFTETLSKQQELLSETRTVVVEKQQNTSSETIVPMLSFPNEVPVSNSAASTNMKQDEVVVSADTNKQLIDKTLRSDLNISISPDIENTIEIIEEKQDVSTDDFIDLSDDIVPDNKQEIQSVKAETKTIADMPILTENNHLEDEKTTNNNSKDNTPRVPVSKPFAPRIPMGGMPHRPSFKGVPPLSGFSKKMPPIGKPPVFPKSFVNEKQNSIELLSKKTTESTEE